MIFFCYYYQYKLFINYILNLVKFDRSAPRE